MSDTSQNAFGREEQGQTAVVEASGGEGMIDLATAEIPSFRALRDARSTVYRTRSNHDSMTRQIQALGESGDPGRRRGFGAWIMGDYERAVALLAAHESEPVATFTRAKALMSLQRFAEAETVFGKLTQAYPDFHPPRAGWIEARLESRLAQGDFDAAMSTLEKDLAAAPAAFHSTAEGQYLSGRRAELERDFEAALDAYGSARELDPTLRESLFHGGYLAERCGLDELALEFYEVLARQLPIDRHLLFNLGILYEDLGRDQDAAACYDLVRQSDPRSDRARLFLEDARASLDMYYDEDRERKEDRLNQILRIPITDFELSVRARNCLNKMNITTLGDLVQRTEQELLSYKNFGETSLAEIKEILHTKGLRLGMPREEAVASVELHARRVYTGENADTLNKPISELQLSIRARRTVEALGCLTMGDIVKHSADELLGMPNFGVTSLQELKSTLAENGLKLRGD